MSVRRRADILTHVPYEAEKWNSFYQEFAGKSDRATAIVGAAMIEAALEKAIQYNADANTPTKGKLKALSVKIDEAHRLGLIAEAQRQDLHTIRNLRNSFAHELPASTFEEPGVREECGGLEYGRRFLSSAEPSMRELFASTVAALMYWLSLK